MMIEYQSMLNTALTTAPPYLRVIHERLLSEHSIRERRDKYVPILPFLVTVMGLAFYPVAFPLVPSKRRVRDISVVI